MWLNCLTLVLFWNMWSQLYAEPPPSSFSNEHLGDIGVKIIDENDSEPELLEYIQQIVDKHSNYPLEVRKDDAPKFEVLSYADELSSGPGSNYNNYVNPSNFRDLHNYVYNMPALQSYNKAEIATNTPQIAKKLDKNQVTEAPKSGQENRTENSYICFKKTNQNKKQCINKNITNKFIINEATNTTQIQVNQFGQNKNVLHNLVKILNDKENNSSGERATDLNFQKDESNDFDINSNSTIQKIGKQKNNHMENVFIKILKLLQGVREEEITKILTRDKIAKNDTSVITEDTSIQNSTTHTSAEDPISSTSKSVPTTTTTLSITNSANTTSAGQAGRGRRNYANLTVQDKTSTCAPILRTISTSSTTTEATTSSSAITKTTPQYPSWFQFKYIPPSSTPVDPAVNISKNGSQAANQNVPLKEGQDHNSCETNLRNCLTSSEKIRNRSRGPSSPHRINREPIAYELNHHNSARKHRPRRPKNLFERRPGGTIYLHKIVQKPQQQFTSSVRFAKLKPAKPCQSAEDFDGVYQPNDNADFYNVRSESAESAEALDYGAPNY